MMKALRSAICRRGCLARGGEALALAILLAGGVPLASAETPCPCRVEVSDVTAKVGEHAVMLATVRLNEGYRLLEAYNNRVMQLSSWDDGVTFERKVVNATVRDGALVFAVGLEPTKPGKHAINGVFRFGYIEDDTMMMVSVPLEASVTGTE
jgi:hypothetical protein